MIVARAVSISLGPHTAVSETRGDGAWWPKAPAYQRLSVLPRHMQPAGLMEVLAA
jgi:hypothetical protein